LWHFSLGGWKLTVVSGRRLTSPGVAPDGSPV